MARRRFRRAGGTWLPPLPTFYGENDEGVTFYESFATAGAVGEKPTLTYIPVVTDATPNVDAAVGGVNHSLRDVVEGQEYVLKRAVGKFFAAPQQLESQASAWLVMVCAALAVLPVEDSNPSAPALEDDDMNPLLAQNAMSPWLWRRTWILSNNLTPNTYLYYPNSTAGYGSVMDGGHIDTKGVSRRIRREQRLFMLVAAQTLQSGENPMTFHWGYDLRFFGAMRKARGQSTFK